MRVAVIGAGNVGKALGEALVGTGHDVVYGVRDPKRSEAKPAKTVSDAMQGSDAVILATPYDTTGPLLRENATALAGKVVIDATNPLKPDLSGLSLTVMYRVPSCCSGRHPQPCCSRPSTPQATAICRIPITHKEGPSCSWLAQTAMASKPLRSLSRMWGSMPSMPAI